MRAEATAAPTMTPSRTGAHRALSFDRGGAGLALIAASHVLDAHGVSIEPADSGEISIRFPREGGSQ
jgi:hypothetical protein